MSSFQDLTLSDDTIDFQELANQPTDIERLVSPDSFRQDTIDYLMGTGQTYGATLPWGETHDNIRFRPGEVSLWMGMNGHGKSLLTSQVFLDFIHQGQKVCIASFEMKPKATLARMARQAAMASSPTEAFVHGFIDHAIGKLYLYDKQGNVDAQNLLGIIRYAVRKHGIQQFVIDSLMKCVKGEDDYNGQKDFVNSLCTLAQDENLHIHLVHHSRKLADESQLPGKMDAKGSGAIVDQVDQSFVVWRNKKKEEAVRAGNKDYDLTKPDAILRCDKNRHGEWEGSIGLYFSQGPLHYARHQGRTSNGYDYRPFIKSEREVAI